MKKFYIILITLTLIVIAWHIKTCEYSLKDKLPFQPETTITPAQNSSNVIKHKKDEPSYSGDALWRQFEQSKTSASFVASLGNKGPQLKFIIYGKLTDNNHFFDPSHVDIHNLSHKKRIQKLNARDRFLCRFENVDMGWSKGDVDLAEPVQLVDLNFDGYLDLRLLYNTGATGNNWYASYIYNPSSGTFKFHRELFNLSGVRVDADNKRIITYNRNGCCDECMEYYKLINNKLVLVKLEWSEMDRTRDEEVGGFGCFKYTWIPRNKYDRLDRVKLTGVGRPPHACNRMKNIKEEPLFGSLDGRPRGPLGNIMN